MKLRFVPALMLCAALGGCVSVKAVDGMAAANVGDDITVTPQVAWAGATGVLSRGANAIWTIDGFGLNEVSFMTGIVAGDPVIRVPNVDRKDLTVYNVMMLPDEIMEMVATTLGKEGFLQIRTEGLRPVPFGSATGFRFELNFTTKDGLQMKGAALFAQRRNRLDVILYTAPAEYYFDRYMPTVEKVFASIQVPEAPGMKAAN